MEKIVNNPWLYTRKQFILLARKRLAEKKRNALEYYSNKEKALCDKPSKTDKKNSKAVLRYELDAELAYLDEVGRILSKIHKKAVDYAICHGKKIPARVLLDYPDLK